MTLMAMLKRTIVGIAVLMLLPSTLLAQVTFERLLTAADEPHNWLTYSGTYASQRHSSLSQIDRANVADLELKWVFQLRRALDFQATPLVVDGVMYLTQPPNDVVALDARSGRVFWVYEHVPSRGGGPNRGLAIHGDTLFMGTADAMLVAVDARSGGPLWKVQVADPAAGYSIRHAPLVVKDKVLVGTSGGELGVRGLLAAYDVKTGEEVWRFYTIPAPGEPGSETWEPCTPELPNCDPDAWMHGGGGVWLTGSYDPETNLTFWGVGNPGPNYSHYQRPGDNLYASSVVALDADTGELAWHFQFTPGDPYDYDALQIPVLVDLDINGATVKAMLWANRNGFFYILDRTNGRFLRGQAFSRVNWASGLDDSGRPIQTPQGPDAPTYPGKQGATNWYSPSYSPRTGLLYLSTWENIPVRRRSREREREGDPRAHSQSSPHENAARWCCAGWQRKHVCRTNGFRLGRPGGQNTMSAIAHATPQHTGSVTEREKPRGSGHRPAPVRVTVLDDQICQSPRQHAGQRLVVHCDACVLRRHESHLRVELL